MELTKEDFCFLAGMDDLKEDFEIAHELAESVRNGKPVVWNRSRKWYGEGRTVTVRENALKLIIQRREGNKHPRKVRGKSQRVRDIK